MYLKNSLRNDKEYRYHKIEKNNHRVLVNSSTKSSKSTKSRNHEKLEGKRGQAEFGSQSYKDGLRRAFTNLKKQIFFNPDMNQFITLTYKKQDNTLEEVFNDIKQFMKKEKRQTAKISKYAYVLEYQKRGSIHVHMIATNNFKTDINKNGYRQLTNWKKGFSSILSIGEFDKNFKPYLYLFKYMNKTERIGKSFIHTSKNLDKPTNISYTLDDKLKVNELFKEKSQISNEFINVKYRSLYYNEQ